MANLLPEILQEILIRLNVRDLIRCKSVCKSWLSLISCPKFVQAQLHHSYLRDHYDYEIGHRRMVMCKYASFYVLQQYEIDNHLFDKNKCHLLGSSDGLICISPSRTEIVVVNPSIREVSKLTNPQIPENGQLCWGFGCDSSSKDYKVVLGFRKGENCTCFQVFSLRSRNWKLIGELNYDFITRIGILCNGALHWVAFDSSSAKYIIHSFNLSNETFVEIPQPDDLSYRSHVAQHSSMRLGTMEDCLCIFRYEMLPYDLWVMREYNVNKSWEIFGHERKIKYEAVHCIKPLKNYIPYARSFCHETWLCRSREYFRAPIYVESLVSPHFHTRPKRKRSTTNTHTRRSPPEVMLNNYTEAYAAPHAIARHPSYVVPHSYYPSHQTFPIPRVLAGHHVYAIPYSIAGHHLNASPHAIAGHHPNAFTYAITGHHPNAFTHFVAAHNANALPHAIAGHDANALPHANALLDAIARAEDDAGATAIITTSTSNS